MLFRSNWSIPIQLSTLLMSMTKMWLPNLMNCDDFVVVIHANKIHNEARVDVKNGSFGLLPPSRVTLALF